MRVAAWLGTGSVGGFGNADICETLPNTLNDTGHAPMGVGVGARPGATTLGDVSRLRRASDGRPANLVHADQPAVGSLLGVHPVDALAAAEPGSASLS